MNWTVNQSILTGNDHIFVRKNCQDFCDVTVSENRIAAIVCDGCSEGNHSEVGANLLGAFILNKLMTKIFNYDIHDDVRMSLISNGIRGFIENNVHFFIEDLLHLMCIKEEDEVRFINHNLLSTIIFCVIDIPTGVLVVGRCGDGVTIINDDVNCIDHDNKPHYLAYSNVPDELLTTSRTKLEGIKVEVYDLSTTKRIVIASDGLKPLLDKTDKDCCINNLYGNVGRQLQRRFNVWQQKQKLFYDDVSCIIIEKNCETNT